MTTSGSGWPPRARSWGRKLLGKIGALLTADTILRWGSDSLKPGSKPPATWFSVPCEFVDHTGLRRRYSSNRHNVALALEKCTVDLDDQEARARFGGLNLDNRQLEKTPTGGHRRR